MYDIKCTKSISKFGSSLTKYIRNICFSIFTTNDICLFGLYFLYPLLLASIFSTFRDRATNHQQTLEHRKKLAISAIFTLLDIENKNYLTKNNILEFTDCYLDQQNHIQKIKKLFKNLFL